MKITQVIPFLLLACRLVSAEPLPIFDEIRLPGKRVIKNVEFVSFAQSGAMAKWDGGRGALSYASLPEDIRDQVMAHRPPEPPERTQADPVEEKRATQATRPVTPRRPVIPRRQHVITRPATNEVSLDKISAIVKRRAEQYYKDGRKNGSGSTLVFDLSIDLGEPQPVPGWGGRYSVEGTANYNFYDSVWGGSFSHADARFSCEVEAPAGAPIKITSFNPKF